MPEPTSDSRRGHQGLDGAAAPLLELVEKKASLEDVFVRLTGREPEEEEAAAPEGEQLPDHETTAEEEAS